MSVHVISVGISLTDFFELADYPQLYPDFVPAAPQIQERWNNGDRLGFDFDRDPVEKNLEAAFGLDAAPADPQRAFFQETAAQIGADQWAQRRHLCAELDTVRTVAGAPLPPGDSLFLLASDTRNGIAAAIWTALALAGGDTSRVRYLPQLQEQTRLPADISGLVHVIRLPGLHAAASDEGFGPAMQSLGLLGRLLLGTSTDSLPRLLAADEPVRLHLSGGYKAAIPYLTALAEWLTSLGADASAWVLHEDAQHAFRLPLRRLDPAWVKAELAGFSREGIRARMPADNLLQGYAYHPYASGAKLTAFGTGMQTLFGVPTEPAPQ